MKSMKEALSSLVGKKIYLLFMPEGMVFIQREIGGSYYQVITSVGDDIFIFKDVCDGKQEEALVAINAVTKIGPGLL